MMSPEVYRRFDVAKLSERGTRIRRRLAAQQAGRGVRRQQVWGGTFVWWKRYKAAADAEAARTPADRGAIRRGPADGPVSAYESRRTAAIRVPSQFDPQILSRLITAVESC
jgi:hypothetical protein